MDVSYRVRKMKKKNILLITADQLRADALGCYGNKICRTPNIDSLAGSGVLFANSFTPNPICVPARASITTGNYSHFATGTKNNGGFIHNNQTLLAKHFSAFGYRTYACGKLHYTPYAQPGAPRLTHGFGHWDSHESGRILAGFDPQNEQRGLEDYIDYLADAGWGGYGRGHGIGNNDVRPCPSPLPAEHHPDHWVADRTIQKMREHAADYPDKPFLIWTSFPKPHAPLDPPAEYAQMYDPRQVPAPFGDESLLADRNPYMEYTRITHALDSLSPQARRVARAYYYGLISFQDAQVGRIMQALEEIGEVENTIIVYTADHGDLMGDFGTFFKCSFQQGSLNVPIIFAGAGVPKEQRRTQLVGLQDILPTAAELTECCLDQKVHGLDLTDVMNDSGAEGRDIYYAQCLDAPQQMAMVTDGSLKYCYCQQGPTEELYDLVNDPHELVNLATDKDHHADLLKWREVLINQARRLGDNDILDPSCRNGLVGSSLNREDFKKLPITGMGWRWY